MMEAYDVQRMLSLRKLTRSIADTFRRQVKEHLAAIAPLVRPKSVFGDYIESATKESSKGADLAFKDLQGLYETIAGAKRFDFPTELKVPIDIVSSAIEITPVEYRYQATANQHSKS
ncbi:MAG TPA: hypothetical protein VJX67_20470, partial [Blastocatellia bacterium]|nr:hypothetical protein [Blastocatellia bacterium]